MDIKTQRILYIMAISVLLAICFNLVKKEVVYRDIARTVFMETNLPVEQLMKGINFKKSVKIYKVKKGTVLIQYQIPNAPQGNFYGQPESSPNKLGVSCMGYDSVNKNKVMKEQRIYVAIKDTDVLMSYAAPIKDDWSTPEDEEVAGGRAIQIFTTCKECFKVEPQLNKNK